MAASPVAVLTILGLYVAIYAVIVGSIDGDAGTCGANHDQNCNLTQAPTITQPDGSIWDTFTGILNSIWSVAVLIVGALTFNVPGAPFFVQGPIATTIIGSLAWSVATLVRGN